MCFVDVRSDLDAHVMILQPLEHKEGDSTEAEFAKDDSKDASADVRLSLQCASR